MVTSRQGQVGDYTCAVLTELMHCEYVQFQIQFYMVEACMVFIIKHQYNIG